MLTLSKTSNLLDGNFWTLTFQSTNTHTSKDCCNFASSNFTFPFRLVVSIPTFIHNCYRFTFHRGTYSSSLPLWYITTPHLPIPSPQSDMLATATYPERKLIRVTQNTLTLSHPLTPANQECTNSWSALLLLQLRISLWVVLKISRHLPLSGHRSLLPISLGWSLRLVGVVSRTTSHCTVPYRESPELRPSAWLCIYCATTSCLLLTSAKRFRCWCWYIPFRSDGAIPMFCYEGASFRIKVSS